MFGYVRVYKPELKVKEYELYRGAYCGLCRSMGKCTGQCSRMTLSYDFAFLVLVRATLTRETLEYSTGRCIAHPLTKRSYMKRNPTLDYCSGAAALLNYHKVADDLSDERGAKKLRALVAYPFVAYGRKKALKMGLSPLDKSISEGLERLSAIEKEGHNSVDLPAEAFGKILGEIMAYGIDGTEARIGRSLGVAVGKWIYVTDALDDWGEDAKKKRYNPFLLLYGKDVPDTKELESIRIALKNLLIEAEDAFDLCDFRYDDVKNILANTLFLGMPNVAENIDGSAKHHGEKGKKGTKKDVFTGDGKDH